MSGSTSYARMPSAQARAANKSGRYLEDRVEIILQDWGYVRNKEMVFNTPCFIRQHKQFKNIYGSTMANDFFVLHPQKYPRGLIIECKNQDSPGSVDEKLPFVFLSLQATGCPAILLAEGRGFKESALLWCEEQARNHDWFLFYRGYAAFRKALMKNSELL